MSMLRHPKTTQEKRYSKCGWSRPSRIGANLVDVRDDLWKPRFKTWKKYRKTQYKIIEVKDVK